MTSGEKLDAGIHADFTAVAFVFRRGHLNLTGTSISKQISCQAPLPSSEDNCVESACRHVDAASSFSIQSKQLVGLFDWTEAMATVFVCFLGFHHCRWVGRLIGLDAMATVSWSVRAPLHMGNKPRCRNRRSATTVTVKHFFHR